MILPITETQKKPKRDLKTLHPILNKKKRFYIRLLLIAENIKTECYFKKKYLMCYLKLNKMNYSFTLVFLKIEHKKERMTSSFHP